MSSAHRVSEQQSALCPKEVIRASGIAGASQKLGQSRQSLRRIKQENSIPALRPGPKPVDAKRLLATLPPEATAVLSGSSLANACARLNISRSMARHLLAHLKVKTGVGVRPRKGVDLILVEKGWNLDQLKAFVASSSNTTAAAGLGVSLERMRGMRKELGLPGAKNGRPFRDAQ